MNKSLWKSNVLPLFVLCLSSCELLWLLCHFTTLHLDNVEETGALLGTQGAGVLTLLSLLICLSMITLLLIAYGFTLITVIARYHWSALSMSIFYCLAMAAMPIWWYLNVLQAILSIVTTIYYFRKEEKFRA